MFVSDISNLLFAFPPPSCSDNHHQNSLDWRRKERKNERRKRGIDKYREVDRESKERERKQRGEGEEGEEGEKKEERKTIIITTNSSVYFDHFVV